MSQIPPFTASILQGPQVQREQQADKSRQIGRSQQLRRNIALRDDQLEHSVESPQELTAIHEEQNAQDRRRRKGHGRPGQDPSQPPANGQPPRLDVTA